MIAYWEPEIAKFGNPISIHFGGSGKIWITSQHTTFFGISFGTAKKLILGTQLLPFSSFRATKIAKWVPENYIGYLKVNFGHNPFLRFVKKWLAQFVRLGTRFATWVPVLQLGYPNEENMGRLGRTQNG